MCVLLQTERRYHKMFDLILTIIMCDNATLRARFPLLERELTISFFDLKLFWLDPDTIDTDMRKGGKVFQA